MDKKTHLLIAGGYYSPPVYSCVGAYRRSGRGNRCPTCRILEMITSRTRLRGFEYKKNEWEFEHT